MGFWDAVASAGPYANNLHLTPDRQPRQQFLQALPDSQRTVSKHFKAILLSEGVVVNTSRYM